MCLAVVHCLAPLNHSVRQGCAPAGGLRQFVQPWKAGWSGDIEVMGT